MNEQIYSGPERRREQEIMVQRCDCHLKHTAMLEEHKKKLERLELNGKADHQDIWSDVKAKVPWMVFIPIMLVFLTALGFIFQQNTKILVNIATVKVLGESTENKVEFLSAEVEKVSNKMDDHIENYRKNNGGN